MISRPTPSKPASPKPEREDDIMLHANPLMADIGHWRNLQSLLLESAKEKRRTVVIHENGEILKFAHPAMLDESALRELLSEKW
jgi:hypothetical protein